ncbi:hypothetical protein [Desulfobacter sp. UBA2225]|uniref:hypothetical protein n=1 Tax=Desulfobacter sp. UBA2225 TaxID=1961413 RepID=UPI00257C3AED|nr:hypothetical protein [Desulfobacter sp. UBA2225]
MTEIKKKKKKLVWPWVLLGLGVIAVLIYFLAFHDYNGETNEVPKISELIGTEETDLVSEPVSTEETDLINVKENNSTVAAYINFVETSKNKMSLEHEYTNEALSKLVEATNAMAGEVGYEVRADIEKVKEYAEMIEKDPFATTHADSIKKADDILTNVLQNIQKAKYPGLTNEVAELKIASESIKPGVLTLDQKDGVKTFFSKAADLLHKMN